VRVNFNFVVAARFALHGRAGSEEEDELRSVADPADLIPDDSVVNFEEGLAAVASVVSHCCLCQFK
jgi:hypothetical protein